MLAKLALTALVVWLGATGCAAPAAPSTPSSILHKAGTIRFADISNPDVRRVPLWLALDDLQSQGYSVEKQSLASSGLIADLLTRGDADVGLLNNQTMWLAIHKGSHVHTTMGWAASATIVETRNEIQDCRELNGRPLAVPATTGVNPALLGLYLRQNCGGASPNYLVISDSAGRDAALISGQVDGLLTQGEEALRIDQQAPGKFHVLASLAQAFPQVQVDGIQMRDAWVRQNPELARDFLRALLTANRQVDDHPAVLYAESEKRLAIDSKSAEQIGSEYLKIDVWDPNGLLTAQSVQATLDFLTGIDSLPAGIKAADVADLSYLDAVLDEIGRR